MVSRNKQARRTFRTAGQGTTAGHNSRALHLGQSSKGGRQGRARAGQGRIDADATRKHIGLDFGSIVSPGNADCQHLHTMEPLESHVTKPSGSHVMKPYVEASLGVVGCTVAAMRNI